MTALAHTSNRHGNLAAFADASLVPYRTRNASIKCGAEPCMTVIALTREIGSLGTEVAAGVAKKLGLKNIHSEIVAPSVAQRLGVAEDTVLRHVDGSPSLLDRWQVDRRKLSRYTSEEIMGLAQHGKVLIQGWGAATLLRDIPQVISVRVCAPMDFRVRVMMERLGNKNAKAVREEIGSEISPARMAPSSQLPKCAERRKTPFPRARAAAKCSSPSRPTRDRMSSRVSPEDARNSMNAAPRFPAQSRASRRISAALFSGNARVRFSRKIRARDRARRK